MEELLLCEMVMDMSNVGVADKDRSDEFSTEK